MTGIRRRGRVVCVAVAVAVLASSASAARKPLAFEGVGGRTLAGFRLVHPATLRWQTSGGWAGGAFAVKVTNPRPDLHSAQLVFARAKSGSVQLPPGRYVLSVAALPGTRWEMTIG